jgi:hypothetical protein
MSLESRRKEMYRTISVCVAFGLLGLAASASANLVTNGDFENDLGVNLGTSPLPGFYPNATNWFDENGAVAGDGDFLQWEDANVNVPADANGQVWGGLGIGNAGQGEAAFYQAIGTYADNMSLTVSLNVGDRSNKQFPDLQVNLYSGDVTGADGTRLGAGGLGATLLDQSALITAVGLGFDDTDASTHTTNVPPFVLETGTSGTAGTTLWLEIRTAESADSATHQALIDDVVVSNAVVTWTGGGDGRSLFQEANWDAAGGILTGDYIVKTTGVTPHDLVIDIAKGATDGVGGAGGWDGTLDLGNVGSLTVEGAADYFRMNTSGNATLKDGTAYFKAGNNNFDFEGTWDNMDVTIGTGINLAGSLALINGTTVDTAWFADNSASLNGGSILTIREDSATSFQNNTVDFLDLDSKIVYSNTGRTVAEVTTDHLSHFRADGAAAVLNSNIYVDKESSTGQTIVRRSRQIAWTGANDNGWFFSNGNWDVDDVVVKVAEVCTLDNRDLVIDIAGKPTYIVGGDNGINGTLDLNNNSTLIVTNNADSFRMRDDGSLVIKNGTAWFKSGTGDFDFEGTFDNMDVYVNGGTDLAGSLDLINGTTFDTTWFAYGGTCDIDGGSTLTIREDGSGSFTGTTVNFLDLDSKIVYSNTGREVAEVTSQHLSQFTVNGTAASVGVNINVFTDSGTGYTTVQAIPRGTLFKFR